MTLPVFAIADLAARWISLAVGLLLLILLGMAYRRVKATTLAAPVIWAMAACASLIWLAERHFANGDLSSSLLRFCVASATFCPLMTVLGAKRPQHRGWQWVVASLWLVLVWPAGQAALSNNGLHLFVAWKLFLLGLVAFGLVNYLPTRHWPAALLVAGGQLALLAEFLWPGDFIDPGMMMLAALTCFLAAGGLACRTRSTFEAPFPLFADITEKWRRFRDAYGLLWGLRILGRLNETAALKDWPLRLEWRGLVCQGEKQPSTVQLEELNTAFATLLRRFS